MQPPNHRSSQKKSKSTLKHRKHWRMADEEQETSKPLAPSTKKVATVKHLEKSKAPVTPRNMFPGDGGSNSGDKPSRSDPMSDKNRIKEDTRTRVLTSQGKHVLITTDNLNADDEIRLL